MFTKQCNYSNYKMHLSAECGEELTPEFIMAIRAEPNLWAFTHYKCYLTIIGNNRVPHNFILCTGGIMYVIISKKLTT